MEEFSKFFGKFPQMMEKTKISQKNGFLGIRFIK